MTTTSSSVAADHSALSCVEDLKQEPASAEVYNYSPMCYLILALLAFSQLKIPQNAFAAGAMEEIL